MPILPTFKLKLPKTDYHDLILKVLGGKDDDASSVPYSESFKYRRPKRKTSRKGRWRKGSPLPPSYRDSGLDGFCAIKLNETHAFIAGGFVGQHELKGGILGETLQDIIKREEEFGNKNPNLGAVQVGGVVLANITLGSDTKSEFGTELIQKNTS